jgi:hypothetical protein
MRAMGWYVVVDRLPILRYGAVHGLCPGPDRGNDGRSQS